VTIMAMMRLMLNKNIVEIQKKFDMSEKLVLDIQSWNQQDIVVHFQISIHEIQRVEQNYCKKLVQSNSQDDGEATWM
jgi:hypothetical protein